MQNRSWSRDGRAVIAAILLFLSAASVNAATTWTGPTSGGSWNNGANWSTNPVVPSATDVTFPAGMNGTVTLDANQSCSSLSFSGGGTLTINGNPDTNTLTFTGSPGVVSLNGATLTINARVSAATGVNFGNGTVVLTNLTNSFTGNVSLSTVTLRISSNGATTSIGNAPVVATTTSTLDIRSLTQGGLIAKYYQLGGIDANQFASQSLLNAYLAGFTPATLGAPNAGLTQCVASTINYTNAGYGGGQPFAADGFFGDEQIVGYWSGKINIPSTGLQSFYTTSDDGSMIFIDGLTVVNNNFFQGATTRNGSANLTAGLHDIVVAFYEGGGGAGVNAGLGTADNNPFASSSLYAGPSSVTLSNNITLNGALTLSTDNETTVSGLITGASGLTLSSGVLNSRITINNLSNNIAGTITLATANVRVASNAGGTGTAIGTAPVVVSGASILEVAAYAQGGLTGKYYQLGGIDSNQFNSLTALNAYLAGFTPATLGAPNTGQTQCFCPTINYTLGGGYGTGSPFAQDGFGGSDNIVGYWSGKININPGGLTSFYTTSDDGSMIFIDGNTVVNNNFFQGATTRTGSINLSSGYHDIVVAFYEGGGGAGINAGLGTANNTPFPSAALYGSGPASVTLANNITLNAPLSLSGQTLTNTTGTIAGAGALTVTNAPFNFTNAGSNYSGLLTVNSTLIAPVAQALGSNAAGTSLSSNATLQLGNGVTVSDAISLSGNATISTPSGSSVIANTINLGTRVLTIGGAGTTNVNSPITDPTGTAAVNVAGLIEGRIVSGGFETTAANPGNGGNFAGNPIVLSPRVGNTDNEDGNLAAGHWGNAGYETWVYTGQYFDADGIFSVAENNDDDARVVIDGVARLNNNQWNAITTTGSQVGFDGGNLISNANPLGGTTNFGMGPNGDGWHDIEIRFATSNGGGSGANGAPGNGWSNIKGFGINNGTTNLGTHNAVNYPLTSDPGDMSVFRVKAVRGGVTIAAGTVRFAATNTYLGATSVNGGILQLTGGTAIPDTNSIFVNGGATLNIQATETVGKVTGGGTISLNAGTTLRLGDANNFSCDCFITGGGAIEKLGTGRMGMTNTSNFTGGTIISAGSILASLPGSFGTGTVTMNGGNISLQGLGLGVGGNGLLGQYYNVQPFRSMIETLYELNNLTMSAPAAVTAVSNVDFSNGGGGGGAPFGGVGFGGTDNMLARWSGKIFLPPGVTTFFTTSDDGSCVWIDDDAGNMNDAPVCYNNFFQGMTTRSGQTANYSTARMHDVVVAFYEGGGGAGMIWEYQPPGGARVVVPAGVLAPATLAASTPLTGQFYNTGPLDGGGFNPSLNTLTAFNSFLNPLTPGITAQAGCAFRNGDDNMNYYGGLNPFAMLGFNVGDSIVARWTGTIDLPAGQTRFYTTSDDGSCIWIDGVDVPVVNNNFYQGATTRSGDTPNFATAGTHTITVGFYEGGGGAGMLAEFESLPIGSGVRAPILRTKVVSPNTSVISIPNAIVVNAPGSITPLSGTTATLTGTIALNGTNTLTLNNGSGFTMTASGVVSGTGNLLKSGTSEVVLSGNNGYGGSTTISSGTLTVSGGNGIGDTSATIIGASGVLNLNTSETIGRLEGIAGSSITLNTNTLTADGAANPFNGIISGTTGGLTKTGVNTLTLGGVNAYSGATNVNAGTLASGTSNVLPDASAVTVNAGILNIGANNDTVASLTLIAGTFTGTTGVLTSTATANLRSGTASGRIGGANGLSKTTAGSVTMSGNNTYTGDTTVTAGTLIANGGSTIPDSSTVNMAGGTLTVGGNETIGNLNGSTNVGIGSNTLTVGGNNNSFGYSGIIAGASGNVTKVGTGTLTLTGANTFDGILTVSAGTLAVGAGAVDNVEVVVNGGTLTVNGDVELLSLSLISGTINGGSTITCDDITLLSGTCSCNLDGFFGIVKAGAGTVTLSGNNVYLDQTVVAAGTLSLAGGNAIPDDSEVTFNNVANAILNLNNTNETIGGLADGGPVGGNVVLGSATLTINPFVSDYFGAISGTGGIEIIGGGFQTLYATSTYGGTTVVTDGSLEVNGSISSTTTVGADGILAGTGTINGSVTVQAGGTVEPGSGAVGTLTTGSITFQANSNLDILVDGSGGCNSVAVTGTVSIASASIINTFGTAPLPDSQGYLVIDNDGGDAITGPIFSGSNNGAVIGIVNPNNGHIYFSGPNAGTGNDVVLLPNRNPVAASGNGPYTFNEGPTHTLNGSATDPDGDTLIYTWTYNNPAPVVLTGQSPTFPELNGTNVYNVTLTVTDPLNGSVVADGSAFTVVTINNVAPSNLVLAFSPSANPVVDEGTTFEVSGTFFDPGTLDAHTVVIDWGDGDTTFVNLAANDLTIPPTAHVYANDIVITTDPIGQSPYSLTVTVIDDGATPVSDGTAVTVNDVVPHLILTAHYQGPEEALVNPYVMTILDNTDPGSDTITQYTIHWGDGSLPEIVNGPISLPFPIAHVYTDAPALHLITIDGVDENGTHLVIGKIDPNDQPKFGSEFLLVTVNLGESFNYDLVTDGGMTGDPTPTLEIMSGLPEITSCGISFSGTTFTSPSLQRAGSFTVLIKAVNFIKTNYINLIIQVKSSSGSDTPQIISKAVAIPNPVQAGKAVEFSVVATDRNGDNLSYFWDFGDGTSNADENRKAVTTHKYAQAGNYVVTVVVSDGFRTTNNKINMVVTGVANNDSFSVSSFKLSFDFKTPAKSSMIVIGTVRIPASMVVPGSDVNVSIPGTTYNQTFHMDSKGIGGDTTSQFTLKVSVPGTTESIAKFTMHLKGVDAGGTKLFDRLTALGYLNKKIGKPGEEIFLPLQITAPATGIAQIKTISTVYTCVLNKLGKATLKK